MKPKVLWMQTINAGVCYYRMYCFAKKMDELGLVHSRMFPDFDPGRVITPCWEDDIEKHMGVLEELVDWSDMVICQYVASAKGLSFVEAIKETRPILMEVDDYFSGVPGYSVAYNQNRPGDGPDFWSIRQLMVSSGVIVSTDYLKNLYQQYNKNIFTIPNCIDFDLWDKYKSNSNDKVRIGWIGGATHEGDLRLIKDILYDLLEECKGIEVYIVSAPPPDWPKHERMNLITKWATIDKYPGHVKELSFDIGIAPLRDNYFNRAKSNLKYLEYSTCKIPTVASDVEPFRKDYVGYIAKDENDWWNCLSDLANNQDLRLEKGFNAYFDIKGKFNLDIISRKYSDLIKGVIDGSINIRKSQVESSKDSSYYTVERSNR